MAHRFDSGLATSMRAAVRSAAVAALAPLRKSNGLYLVDVIALPCSVREDPGIVSDMVNGQSPLVGISCGSQRFSSSRSTDGTSWSGALRVVASILVRNQRNVMAALAGDVVSASDATKDPGAETVLEHVFERLAGAATGVAVAPTLRPDSEESVVFAEEWSIWEQTYIVDVDWTINPNRDETAVADSVQINNISDSGGQSVVTITQLEEPPP